MLSKIFCTQNFRILREKIAQIDEFVQKIAVFCQYFSLHTFLSCATTIENRVFSF